MGNFISCVKKSKKEQLLGNQCPYCNFNFTNENDKKKHMKNCIYNRPNESEQEFTIYSDPYKL